MAANQGSENLVAAICDDGIVIRMNVPVIFIVGSPSIVEMWFCCSSAVGL